MSGYAWHVYAWHRNACTISNYWACRMQGYRPKIQLLQVRAPTGDSCIPGVVLSVLFPGHSFHLYTVTAHHKLVLANWD